jgi:hypothetical protein
MALGTSDKASKNYLAKIVALGVPVAHPNAERLQGFIIDGNRIWTDLTRHTGEIGVYFPLECKLNTDLLSRLNLYREGERNVDPNVKGYFEKQGRVRAVKLRGEPSEGFFLTLEEVIQALGEEDVDIADVDTEFDMWGGQIICEKYIPPTPMRGSPGEPHKRVKRTSRLIEDQFRFHEDTAQLKKNIHRLEPTNNISVTYKLHGTSFVVSKVLVKRKLAWYEKALRWLGVNIQETEYDIIYSSRSVVKNEYLDKINNHFYGVDLWADVKDALHEKTLKGITLYGEAVGYTSTGRPIQGGYDYGYTAPRALEEYKEGVHFGTYIYRITLTNVDGQKIELSWDQIKEYCTKYGLRHVPEIYYGTAISVSPVVSSAINWHDRFLEVLTAGYLERNCHMCVNKVPAEGVVVRVDRLFEFEAYKLKSFKFLERETKELDKGEADMETEQTVTNES